MHINDWSITLERAVWEGFSEEVGCHTVSKAVCSKGEPQNEPKVQWENEPSNVTNPTQGAEGEAPTDVCDGNSQATGIFKSNCFSFIFILILVQKLD